MAVIFSIVGFIISVTFIRCQTFGTLKNVIHSGYQGWFAAAPDGSGRGWQHYEKGGIFEPPSDCVFDLWPDMDDFDDDEKYATPFLLPNGKNASVFSAFNPKTVSKHFEWMSRYNIDGVFLQRFVVSVIHEHGFSTQVLHNVMNASAKFIKSFSIMYDLSGTRLDQWDDLINDWNEIKSEVTTHPSYQHHNKKPVVIVWGLGFNDRYLTEVDQYLNQTLQLINFFKGQGVTLILGVPTYWRTLNHDTVSDPYFLTVLKALSGFGFIQPWNVGRFAAKDLDTEKEIWRLDQQWCDSNGIEYMPVIYPGFSWHHLKPSSPIASIPRLKGQFLWKQFQNINDLQIKYAYQAMFDEINEGTAILKVTNDPPEGFLTYEGLPSDFYLKLVGEGKRRCIQNQAECGNIPF